jgi:serine/threonine protein kinase
MSPEQCLGQRVGARSDLYSLGVVLYEMLAGRPPFIDPLASALLVKQATAPPPPLPKLREDIPRPLALSIHSLLAKRPEDRPRTAAAVKISLERSLARPERTLPDLEPLSSMVAAANPARSVIFRVGTPLILVMMFGALLAWGYTGESAPIPPTAKLSTSLPNNAQISPVSYKSDALANVPVKSREDKSQSVELTMEQARRVASRFAKGTLGAVQLVETDAGQSIVAVNSQRRAGTSTFFVVERQQGRYRMSAQGALDAKGFSHASWSSELVDADEDGYPEVIFNGNDPNENQKLRRLVLFVPNDNRTYSMQMNGDSTARGTPRISWLSNAVGTDAAAYRTALRQKAKAIVAKR